MFEGLISVSAFLHQGLQNQHFCHIARHSTQLQECPIIFIFCIFLLIGTMLGLRPAVPIPLLAAAGQPQADMWPGRLRPVRCWETGVHCPLYFGCSVDFSVVFLLFHWVKGWKRQQLLCD